MREFGEGWWHIPESLFIMAGVLHHQILIWEGDMQSVVFAKGEQRNISRMAENAEEEQNSFIRIFLVHPDGGSEIAQNFSYSQVVPVSGNPCA